MERRQTAHDTGRLDMLLAWYFVIVWGSGYLATKTALHYTAPFTFLTLRYIAGVLCLVPWLLIAKPVWPRGWELFHVGVAGVLLHAVNLSGSHYAQYLGMSAGIAAVLLATQPLITAVFAHRYMGQRLAGWQWVGVLLGLVGVMLVVWHKIDVNDVAVGSLIAVACSLAAITVGTLYQRVFCPTTDMRSGAFVQFVLSLAVVAPLGWFVEGWKVEWHWPLVASIAFLVVFASILAMNALTVLMRRGHATKVTSVFFLTPIVAVGLEWAMFGVVPTGASVIGIVVICAGVAMVSGRRAG